MNMKDFIRENYIRVTSKYIDERPDGLMDDMPNGSTHWRVTIRYRDERMTIYFTMGPYHTDKPSPEDIMYCIQSDTQTASYGSIWEMMEDFGYGVEDGPRCEKILAACRKTHKDMLRLLGQEMLDQFMYEVEA